MQYYHTVNTNALEQSIVKDFDGLKPGNLNTCSVCSVRVLNLLIPMLFHTNLKSKVVRICQGGEILADTSRDTCNCTAGSQLKVRYTTTMNLYFYGNFLYMISPPINNTATIPYIKLLH